MQKDYSNEVTLVKAINGNEPGAWEYLHKLCSGAVRHFVTQNMGSEEDAEDMLSEAIADLMERVRKKKLVMSAKVSTLLISMCRNKWFNEMKRWDTQRRNIGKLREAPGYTHEEKMDRAQFRNAALECFYELEELCQKILRMIEEGKEHKEIGKVLGLAPGTIKNRNHRCHKEWVRLVKRHPGYLIPDDHKTGDGF